MAANIEDEIIHRVRSLPIKQQERVLELVEELEHQKAAAERSEEREFTSLWDKVKDIIESVPGEAWNDLPRDGSVNIDHYLYGHPSIKE
ncbi:MAG: hypothetical protein ACXW18_12275 [Pyrinomonadaceae bacterium]